MTSSVVIDLDQVARELEELRPTWTGSGVVVGLLTWRDAHAPWPQSIVTDRATVTEPESLGITMAAGEGEAHLVLWRGGWADLDLLTIDGGEVIHGNPALTDAASCVELAQAVADELAATPARTLRLPWRRPGLAGYLRRPISQ